MFSSSTFFPKMKMASFVAANLNIQKNKIDLKKELTVFISKD